MGEERYRCGLGVNNQVYYTESVQECGSEENVGHSGTVGKRVSRGGTGTLYLTKRTGIVAPKPSSLGSEVQCSNTVDRELGKVGGIGEKPGPVNRFTQWRVGGGGGKH